MEDFRDYGLVYQRKVCISLDFFSLLGSRMHLRLSSVQTKSKRFHPTRLATTLTSSIPPLLAASMKTASNTITSSTLSSEVVVEQSLDLSPGVPAQQGFIIIETNYRLYAYTGEVS